MKPLKKVYWLPFVILVFSVVFMTNHSTFASSTDGIIVSNENVEFSETFTLHSTEDNDDICEVNENCIWTLTIRITNNHDGPIHMVTVRERLGAELEIDSIETVTHGDLYNWTRGASEKVFLWWFVGELEEYETAVLELLISTDVNPGGVPAYSTCGNYYLNSGAVLKYYFDCNRYVDSEPSVQVKIPCEPPVGISLFSDTLRILPVTILLGAIIISRKRP